MSDWFEELFINELKAILSKSSMDFFISDDNEGNVTIWVNKDTLGWVID